MSQQKNSTMTWASNTSINVNKLADIESDSTAKVDMNGKSNTLAIVSTYPSDTSSNNAAIYCNSYSIAGTSAGDWYLPATGEIYSYLYSNYSTINTTMTKLGWTLGVVSLWSSSECMRYSAWRVVLDSGNVYSDGKEGAWSVSCFLPIRVNSSGKVEVSKCMVGAIMYSDRTCSYNNDTSKTIAGIVVKDNELVMSKPIDNITWSGDYIDTDLPNRYYGNENDMNGKSNTVVIVAANPQDTEYNNAAIYCNSYTGGISGTSGKWYLPAAGELTSYIYRNDSTIKFVTSSIGWYWGAIDLWSSTEAEGEIALFMMINQVGGYGIYGGYKESNNSVSCFVNISDL